MEFCIPWQRWNTDDIHYGLHQTNTRIEDGLFIPIYYANQNIRCQAFHVLTPELEIKSIDNGSTGVFVKVILNKDDEFSKRLVEFDEKNLAHAALHKTLWWDTKKTKLSYETAVKRLPDGVIEWKVQIPDSGIFSCFDTKRKCWYASNESALQGRKWKLVVRTSGLWIDANSFGMEWKLIGAFVI